MTQKLINSWSEIKWSFVNETVKSYRSKIYLAKKSGNSILLRKTQRDTLTSKCVLMWAIRRVTSINQGKNTPGLDRKKYTTNSLRWKLYEEISDKGIYAFQPTPVKRIYIPKPNGKLRPLGIPTIIDRVIQCVALIALEPEWEYTFEHGSYGFRPARSCHDAMIRTYKTLSKKKKTFVLEGDIKGCFDNISHDALIGRLEDFPATDLVRKWLKAGYMTEGEYFESTLGTPQGGIISPLLSNIALHGMEKALGIVYHKSGYVRSECPFTLVRYADDFLVLSNSEERAQESKIILSEYLSGVGLSLSDEKTLISDARKGFDFLGWNFRICQSRYNRRYRGNINAKEVTLVRPSTKSITKVTEKLKTIWKSAVGKPVPALIRNLNSLITGWSNYHRYVNSSRVFRFLDNLCFKQSVRFAKRNHPSKSWKWIREKYYTSESGDRWVFHDMVTGSTLTKFRSFTILDFIPIKYGMIPDDPESASYFAERKANRLKRNFGNRKSMIKIARSQAYICPECGEPLYPDERYVTPIHIHHLIPKSVGGSDKYDNLILLHDYCHRDVHTKKTSKEKLIEQLLVHLKTADIPEKDRKSVTWKLSGH